MKKLRKKKKVGLPSVVKGIRPIEDLDQKAVALFYGRPGSGKTRTAATFPGPHLFLDINNERGLKTVKKVKDAQFAKVRSWDDFQELYWWLKKGQEFETLVLDQITGLQDLCMLAVREHFRMDDDEPFQGFKKFGKLSGDMKQWLGSYREMSDLYNIVFIAHERAFDTGETADDEMDPSIGARVMPSIGSYVEGACDIIGHCFIRNVKKKDKQTGKPIVDPQYCMRIGPHPIYSTKIRRPPEDGKLPAFIVDPSYQKIVAIEAGKDFTAVTKEKKHGKVRKKAR